MVRSKKSIDWKADSCVNFIIGWTELRLMRKLSSSSFEWVQIINMSSIYLVSIRGLTLYRPRMRVIACTRATAINPRYRVVLASLAVARKRYRFLCDRRPACVQRSY